MIEATIEIWSSKAREYDSYTIYEGNKFLKEFKKTYNTENSNRAMSFARRFVKTMRRNGELENHESVTIKIRS